MFEPRTLSSGYGCILPSSSALRRDFIGGTMLFGIPYGLAVFWQDLAIPAARDGNPWWAIGGVLGVVSFVICGVVVWRRKTSSPEMAERSGVPEPDVLIEIGSSQREIDGELSDVARRLVTLARRVRRDAVVAAGNAVTRSHIDDLTACAERIHATLQKHARRRSDTGCGMPGHSIRPRPRFSSVRARSARVVQLG